MSLGLESPRQVGDNELHSPNHTSPSPTRQQSTSTPASSPASPVVSFAVNALSSDERIFLTPNPLKVLDYSVLNSSAVPNRISWLFKPDPSAEYELISDAPFPGPSDAGSASPPKSGFLYDVSMHKVKLNLTALSSDNDFSALVSDLTSRQLDTAEESRLGKKMILRVTWVATAASAAKTGFSDSGVFTVARSHNPQLENDVRGWLDEPGGRLGTETPPSASASAERGGGNPTSDGANGRQSSTGQAAPASRGPLSTGAIAGIVVGASLALVLVAGLAWFLLRRRRQKKRESTISAGQSASRSLTEVKNLQAPYIADSPYSDEGLPSWPLPNIPRGQGSLDQAVSSTHHADAASQASVNDDRDTHSRASAGVSTTVAHLVEEGMTVEEIRRLEDEERQLDAEIERATWR